MRSLIRPLVCLIVVVLFAFFACTLPTDSPTFSGWTINDTDGVRYASRTIDAEGTVVTIRITASPAAISRMMQGALGLSYYSPEADKTVDLLERDSSLEGVSYGDPEIVRVSIEVAAAKSTQIGGSGLNNGGWLQWEQWAAFGCSCDIDTYAGNANLTLKRKKMDGTWVLEDSSSNTGLEPDNVQCSTWFSTYRLRVTSAADGTIFTGAIYW
jgi:hypothetical protein